MYVQQGKIDYLKSGGEDCGEVQWWILSWLRGFKFHFMTDRWSDGLKDIGDCRAASATEKCVTQWHWKA